MPVKPNSGFEYYRLRLMSRTKRTKVLMEKTQVWRRALKRDFVRPNEGGRPIPIQLEHRFSYADDVLASYYWIIRDAKPHQREELFNRFVREFHAEMKEHVTDYFRKLFEPNSHVLRREFESAQQRMPGEETMRALGILDAQSEFWDNMVAGEAQFLREIQ